MARQPTMTAQQELPIQAPVEQPILNSPYYEPKEHWVYDKAGKANRIGGRRSARYWWTTQRTVTGQQELEGIGSDFGSEPLPLVNALRADLAKWRKSGYENATTTTKDLLRHWNSKDRNRRLFFCQIEAVETIIYINEILAAGRTIRGNADVTVDDYQKMLRGEKPALAHIMSDAFFPRLCDVETREDWKSLTRIGCKMATGSGKTVVMAMVIAWAFCNRGRVPGDNRFPNTVLVCCPNLTVKERLQVLRPDNVGGNYYEQFDIVPARMRPLLYQGKVAVTNWHAFAPESPHAEGGANYAVVNKGEESADAFSRRVLKDLHGRGSILVMNDEAHHAWRPAPPEKAVNVGKVDEDTVDGVTDEEAKEATVWVEGLDKLNQGVGVAACIDLSATPFYLNGSGHIPGSPFPWLVSDFGLVDAIESGITKIPRLPVSDESGRPDPKFFRLWDEIKSKCQPADKVRGKPKPEVVWREANAAFLTLAAEWQERYKYHEGAKAGQQFIPPVIIVVCDNVQIAQVFFEMISGETEEEIEDAEGKKTKVKRYNPGGVPFPLLANTEKKMVTLRIDTALLNEAESGEGSTKIKEAQRLRELVANVGTKGTPGEDIRCVVSVQMLTEGWDANNVTQILGLRAFGSQLLCEQVVGRGLRRIDYTPDANEMLSPEYVDVFGIPFSVIPFKGRPKDTPEPEDKPKNHVKALPERYKYEIRFPRVTGYVVDLGRPAVSCDVSKVEHLTIQTLENPTEVFVSPQVGIRTGDLGSLSFETTKLDREEFYANHHFQTVLFELTRVIVNRLTDTADARFRLFSRQQLFPQVLNIVREYAETRIEWNGVDKRELALVKYAQPLVELLTAAIVPDDARGEPPILPVIDRFNPWGSSADVTFSTQRECHPTMKSHVDQVVLDTQQWERSVTFRLESSEVVVFYVRNDHLDFSIPYEFMGVSHLFFPDFIVRLTNDVNLVLEVKGMINEQQKAKFEAAKRWCKAVSNWGKAGRWEFHVGKDPETVKMELKHWAAL